MLLGKHSCTTWVTAAANIPMSWAEENEKSAEVISFFVGRRVRWTHIYKYRTELGVHTAKMASDKSSENTPVTRDKDTVKNK